MSCLGLDVLPRACCQPKADVQGQGGQAVGTQGVNPGFPEAEQKPPACSCLCCHQQAEAAGRGRDGGQGHFVTPDTGQGDTDKTSS